MGADNGTLNGTGDVEDVGNARLLRLVIAFYLVYTFWGDAENIPKLSAWLFMNPLPPPLPP